MSNEPSKSFVFDDVEYQFDQLTREQQLMVNHVADLTNKITTAEFSLDQLRVAKDGFVKMLKSSLTAPPTV